MDDPKLYRSIIGALQYATIAQPEITYNVNKVCQFMYSPLDIHWKVVKRILCYLNGTLHHNLQFTALTKLTLTRYADSDWAADAN